MNLNRPAMTEAVKSEDYTKSILKPVTDSRTMEVVTQTNAVRSPTDSPNATPLVYTVEQVAQMLAISLRSAYNLCNSTTEFRVLRIGGSIRVPKDGFDAWLNWAALDSMEDPVLHLAVHLTLVGALREGEITGLTPEDIDFDAADGIGTFRINKSMQRVRKESLHQVDDGCIIRIFPDKLERSTTSLILKSTKTASSCRTIFMTAALKEELKKWLNQMAADEKKDPDRYRNSGMLFRLPNGLAIEPVLIRKKFLKWQDAHPEFPRIVFHGLRHSSATYQLMISGGDVKAVQGTTGHATADTLVNTYAHIQQSSRVELSRKFEQGFYAKPESPSPQAVPAEGEPTISMTALLELLKDADPEMKAKLRLALLT